VRFLWGRMASCAAIGGALWPAARAGCQPARSLPSCPTKGQLQTVADLVDRTGAAGTPNPTVVRPVLHFRHVAQRSIQIGPKVLDALDTHAQPQQRRRQVLLPGMLARRSMVDSTAPRLVACWMRWQSGAHASAAAASPRTSNEIIVPKPLSWRRRPRARMARQAR